MRRMKIPITGTVREIDPIIVGDDNDIIRPINIDLGNVSWKLIHLDLENEEMEIEVTPAEHVDYDTGEKDEIGRPIWATRPATQEEKDSRMEHALDHSLSRMSKQALYALSGSPALKNPFKEII